MNNIIELFKSEKAVREFTLGIKEENYTYLVNSLAQNHGYLLSYLSYLESDTSIVYIASNLYKANTAYETFVKLAGLENVSLYLADELVSSELLAVSSDFLYERINTIKDIVDGKKTHHRHPSSSST